MNVVLKPVEEDKVPKMTDAGQDHPHMWRTQAADYSDAVPVVSAGNRYY